VFIRQFYSITVQQCEYNIHIRLRTFSQLTCFAITYYLHSNTVIASPYNDAEDLESALFIMQIQPSLYCALVTLIVTYLFVMRRMTSGITLVTIATDEQRNKQVEPVRHSSTI